MYFSGDSRILGVNFGRERVLFAEIFTEHDLFSTAKFHALLNHLKIQDQTQNFKPQSKTKAKIIAEILNCLRKKSGPTEYCQKMA